MKLYDLTVNGQVVGISPEAKNVRGLTNYILERFDNAGLSITVGTTQPTNGIWLDTSSYNGESQSTTSNKTEPLQDDDTDDYIYDDGGGTSSGDDGDETVDDSDLDDLFNN